MEGVGFACGLKMSAGPVQGREAGIARRSFLSLGASVLAGFAVREARADGWEYAAGGYGGLNDTGMEAPADEPSIPYLEFLDQVENKKVERVDFYGAAGEKVYAVVGGKPIRIGEGLPVERSKGWSSPLWVARILNNRNIPYTFHYLDGMSYTTSNSQGFVGGCKGNVFLCLKE